MHLTKEGLGASNAVCAIWLPNISNKSFSAQNGVTTQSHWWVLNVPKMTFVISLSVCWMHFAKVYLGASNAFWAIWLPNISNKSFLAEIGARTPSYWWVMNEPKMTFVIFTF